MRKRQSIKQNNLLGTPEVLWFSVIVAHRIFLIWNMNCLPYKAFLNLRVYYMKHPAICLVLKKFSCKEFFKNKSWLRSNIIMAILHVGTNHEQLVNGAPPTSINSNIIVMVKAFSPTIKIKGLPSISTIWWARTVLLVIVQTLAAYCIAKADKWEQLFTDGTSWRHVAFQCLVICIEEDELFKGAYQEFKPFNFSISFFPIYFIFMFQTTITI